MKSHFKADISDAQFISPEQLYRLLDAAFYQILVRSFIECLTKEAQKVIPGKAGLLGNLVETQRMVETVVDELARATETPKRIEGA